MRDILVGTKTKEDRDAEQKAEEIMLQRQQLQEDREMGRIKSNYDHQERKKNVTPRRSARDDGNYEQGGVDDFRNIKDLSTAISLLTTEEDHKETRTVETSIQGNDNCND